jgi:hypothetical protein
MKESNIGGIVAFSIEALSDLLIKHKQFMSIKTLQHSLSHILSFLSFSSLSLLLLRALLKKISKIWQQRRRSLVR